jgi:hypothetical protein
MNDFFTYSVLQYRHSLALGEILNVGILFYFPVENKFEFAAGDGHRAKAIYPDFNNQLFQSYLKNILSKINEKINLFSEFPDQSNLFNYIRKHILAQDAAGLIFREPVHVKNVFTSKQRAIEEYSKLILPGINIEKPIVNRHNEQFIIRQFNGYLLGKDASIGKKIKKNQEVKTKTCTVKFDYVWNHNYIKPLSFDLADESSIQTKSAVIHSQLIQLKDYAKRNKVNFDLLIAKPQEPDLENEYYNALDLISSVSTNKSLVTQEKWQEYFETTFEHLIHN